MIQTAKRLRFGILLAACAILVAAAAPVTAKSANPKLIPAKAAYVFSVPDMASFWNAWKGNALYAAYKKVVESPDLKPQMESFEKQTKTIETALGFPLDGDTLSQVFKSVDVYLQAGEAAGDANVSFIFVIADKAKFAKLLDLAEKAAAKAATEEGAAPAKDAGTPKGGGAEAEPKKDAPVAAAKAAPEEYKGVQVKEVPGNYEKPTYYAVAGELLIVTNDKAEMKALIDRSKGETKGETLAGAPDYAKIVAALEKKPGEAYYLGNPKYAYDLQGVGAGPMKGVMDLLRKMSPDSLGGASIKFNAKDVDIYSYQPISAESASPLKALMKKYPADKDLDVLGFAAAKPLLVIGTNLFDMEMLYAGLKEMMGAMGNDQNMLDEQLKAAEGPLGFSVKGDLLPALGNNFGLIVNSFSMGSAGPEVDAAIVFGVKDKAKMRKVLDGIVKFADMQMTAMAGGAAGAEKPAMGFKTEGSGDEAIKYFPLPGTTQFSPGFALSGNYLLIGSTKEGLKEMIARKGGKGEAFPANANAKALAARVPMASSVYQYVGVEGILDAAGAALAAMPNAETAKPVIEALRVIKCLASSTASDKDGAVVAESVLLLN